MYWDPFEEMNKMQREMNRIFSSYRERMPYGQSQPAMDLMDKGDELVAIVDLPGVRKEDIKINCTGDYLEISAESSERVDEKKEGYYFAERSATSFKRGISLPAEVIPGKATSTFKNGVLEIRLPKKEKAGKKGHRIKVE